MYNCLHKLLLSPTLQKYLHAHCALARDLPSRYVKIIIKIGSGIQKSKEDTHSYSGLDIPSEIVSLLSIFKIYKLIPNQIFAIYLHQYTNAISKMILVY